MRDTGIGIEQADLELIFQEFGQVAHRLQSRVKGTGLGLPLSKKLAELLGGSHRRREHAGQGSTFSVTLPRSYPQAMGEADDAEEPWTLEPGRVPVLAVEDDPADTFALEAYPGRSRRISRSARARYGREAQHLRQVRPAAVLLDVMLLGDETGD